MLNIEIFSDFIAVGVKNGISKYASAILKDDYSSGMSGYDVEELVKFVVKKREGCHVLEQFQMDSEYGMFCMYYKTKNKREVTQEDIDNCYNAVLIINDIIKDEYLLAVKSTLDIKPRIHDTTRL